MVDTAALKEANDIVSVIGSFVSLDKRGVEYVGLCPFHEDSNPSFYVNAVKQIAHCFSCGWPNGKPGDAIAFVMAHLGLDFKAACEHLGSVKFEPMLPDRRGTQRPVPTTKRTTCKPPPDVDTPDFLLRWLDGQKLNPPLFPGQIWPITDLDGSILGWECRYETPRGKEPRIWSWGAYEGKPARWGIGMFDCPRPLYGLERLTARPDAPVCICEGPKKADAARQLLPWYACLSWTGGANAWWKHNWSVLKGRKEVLLWPDNDMQKVSDSGRKLPGLTPGELLPYDEQPGQKAAHSIAVLCANQSDGLAIPLVRLINVNRMPATWDAADALADGWTPEKTVAWLKDGRLTKL